MPRDERKKILLEGKDKMPAYAKKVAAGDVDGLRDRECGGKDGARVTLCPA